jgi:hypothetical protein
MRDACYPKESRNAMLRARQCEYGGRGKQDRHGKGEQGRLGVKASCVTCFEMGIRKAGKIASWPTEPARGCLEEFCLKYDVQCRRRHAGCSGGVAAL